MMNIDKAKRFIIYIQGILGLKREDIILASFPRTGNTWARYFLCNLIVLHECGRTDVNYELLDRMMPEIGRDNLMRQWPYRTIPRFVKTHRRRMRIYRNNKCVLIIRDPRDVMCSFYVYETGKIKPRFKGSFSDFIRDKKFGLEAWMKHYISWKADCSVLIKYEDLVEDDHKIFYRMLNSLGISMDVTILKHAVESSRFDRMRSVEEKYGLSKENLFKEGTKFTRSGKSGSWKTFFSDNDIDYYESIKKRFDIYEY